MSARKHSTGWQAMVACAALSLAACGGNGGGAVDPARDSAQPIPERSDWARQLIDPVGEHVYPAAVIVEGDEASVQRVDALKEADGECATLSSDAALMALNNNRVVVDLGINTGGVVEIGLCEGGTADLRISYAERREWLNPDGDYSGDNIGQDDDPEARAHTLPAGSNGDVVIPGIQGAQRWMVLLLENAGTVSVDYVRIRIKHLRASADDYSGQFVSSDPQLNTIWAHSAYTTNLVALKDDTRGGNRVYVDGAKRDRMVWLGDVGNQGLAAYYSHKEGTRIMRDTLAMFGCQQYPSGYLPMFSQIYITCDPLNPGPPDGPVPIDGIEPLEEIGRLGEYTAWWVIGLADYYEFTADEAFVKAMLPVARRTMDYFESRSNDGLYCTGQIGSDTPPPSLISGLGGLGQTLAELLDVFSALGQGTGACIPAYIGEINWHPFDVASGEEMHTNAVIYRSYRRLAELERRVGDGEAAAQAIEALAERRRQAMIDAFWDEAVGAFTSNTFNPQTNHTQDGNVEAILGGIVDEQQARGILNFMDERLQGPYGTLTGELANDPFMQQLYAPFVTSRELVARFGLYDTAGAFRLLRAHWGHMANHDPASTVWERIGLDGNIPAYNLRVDFGGAPSANRPPAGFTSAAHGWGAGPLNGLTGFVIGIRPLTPGFGEWIVEPQPGDLEWAQGQVATPRGLIKARWEYDPGRRFKMTVEAPAEGPGTVAVPLLGAPRTIWVNGQLAWDGERARSPFDAVAKGDYVHFEITRQATLSWQSP